MNTIAPLLSEVLRPQNLAEITLPDNEIRFLEAMVASGSPMNLLFYGKPGSGKTSTAKIILEAIDADFIEMNGSFNNGDKGMVKRIEGFAYTTSMTGRPKICFIDEADYMPKAVQDPLRYIIERSSDNCRFLMTANGLSGLTPAIQSRCMPLCFDIQIRDRNAIIDRMSRQYQVKLESLGYSFDQKKIYEIVSLHFPDFRKIANRFQMETFKAA
jgi:DNA polymerase III delta prime subunit